MKKLNLKGVTSETVAGILILIVALVNAVLQMFGYNTLPIADADVSEIVSTVFLIGATLYNTWKNRNVSSATITERRNMTMLWIIYRLFQLQLYTILIKIK